ncbi:dicarboxylate/amino acid:cation symporter [Limobrevibacterium gyesilva]|uniref:Dicarboxylate/amino acid:cation symporter n=1 Tax=Limobrevibacterium gyesilva TaxID=2991712 RepID=A0AA41YK02_9PROT|nr:dicarboxylate/amino acid:cation symporter [Limobrevibacterium gyesilva]
MIQASQSKSLYIQVLIAIVAGVLLGYFWPDIAVQMQPFGDGFVKLVRMMIAPIIFITVVVGIGKLTDTAEVGRIGLKAIIYFEVLTTVAMLVGLIVGHVIEPGHGLNVDPASLDQSAVARYTNAPHQGAADFLLAIIPDTIVGAFARGDILPVLFFAVLFGIALAHLGERGRSVVHFLDDAGAALFGIIGMIMRVAPLGAFGAMSFTIGRYGIGALAQLGILMLCFYITCAVFIFVVMSTVMRMTGLRLWPLLKYIREEFFIVLGTSSSEAALPTLMEKLERLGCNRPLVGLVVPLGYAFNLDGTSIYFTMAITFIAQALNIPLSWGDYVVILAVLLLTSKGAAAVTGGGFITLAATLATLNGKVPVAGIVLVLAIDRFMSEARAITNLFGNSVATVFVAWWEGQLDIEQARRVLADRELALAE